MKSGPQIGYGLDDQVPTQWGAATSWATTNGATAKPTASAAMIGRTRFWSDGLRVPRHPTVGVFAWAGVKANPRRAFGRKQDASGFFIAGIR
jgi:hypothetical protein